MTTTRVLAGLVSNGNVLADGVITPAEIGVLSISSVTYPGDDQAANTAGGQTITVNGAGFASTPTVYVNGVIAPSVSFVSSTQITFTSPARSAGTYDIYVVNPSGSTAIRVYGISYSGTPTWTTAAGELGTVDANFTIQLAATGDAPLTYALSSGSTLPSGVTLSSAGLITGSALTVEQTFNFSVDAIDAQSQETPRSFSVSVSLADPYFRYVTLLLAGDPPVTPFNSDASTNNFNVTINGDARSNNFNPYQAGYYSNYFDGVNNSALTQNSSTNWNFLHNGSSWTIEFFVFPTNTNNTVIASTVKLTANRGFSLQINSAVANDVGFYFFNGTTIASFSSTANLVQNQWNHVGITFDTSTKTCTFYINGVQRGSSSNTGFSYSTSNSTYGLTIGAEASSYLYDFTGYLSNLRISTVVRSGMTTVPTTPYTNDANTSLLTCQSNRFVDNSSNAYTLDINGTPQVAPAQPFTLPSSVATYGSGYFDGSGDYLSAANATALQLSGSQFTIEGWFYLTVGSTDNNELVCQSSGSADANINYQIRVTSTNKLRFLVMLGASPTYIDSPTTITTNSWHHFACVCDGSGAGAFLRMWVDGVYQTASSSFNASGINTNTAATQIGAWTFSSQYVTGYISDFRILKGTALYTGTSNFTPPTAPLTAVTNTSLLSLQYNGGANNSGFKDSSQNNFVITRNGNTTQGTFTPYGSNWSAYFNGSNGSKVDLSSAPLPATGAFTFECFIFPISFSALMIVYSQYNSSFTNRWYIGVNTNGTVVVGGNTLPALTSTAALTLNAWNHFAVTRDGSGNGKVFINGVLSSSNTGWTTTLDTVNPRISGFANPSELCVNGYLSNIRITNTNLYTASFTVPTSPLTAVSGTTLLTLQDNRYKDNSASSITLTPASTSIQRFSPFGPSAAYTSSAIGGSAYFDGSGDYLSFPNTPALSFGTGDFTVEAWVYKFNASNASIIDSRVSGNASPWALFVDGSNFPYFYDATVYTSSISIVLNTWNHVAVTRSSGTLKIFVNGVQGYSATVTTNLDRTGGSQVIGADVTGGASFWNGYISNFRVAKGTALYTSAFTPPTAPLTSTPSTQLLLSNTNAGILDNAMMNDLETVGNAAVTTSVKKYGTGSMYFDGAGDYLNQPSSPNLGIGNVFTVECWLYLIAAPTASNAMYVTDFRGGSTNNYAFGVINSGSNTIFYAYLGAGGEIRGSTNITTGTWYHLAFVNTGSTLTGYLNGVSQGTLATSYNQGATNVIIGARYTGATEYINGYIDDLRITKGYARYTANFTPPTAAFKLK